jgi:precorrin-6B methylase 2
MPQSASVVGLAPSHVFPQNNSTSNCFFYNTVVLSRWTMQPVQFGANPGRVRGSCSLERTTDTEGRITSIERDHRKHAMAHENLTSVDLRRYVDLRLGDASEIAASDQLV